MCGLKVAQRHGSLLGPPKYLYSLWLKIFDFQLFAIPGFGTTVQPPSLEDRGGLAINSLWRFPHGPPLFLPLEGLFVPCLVYFGPVESEKGPV